MMSLIIEFFGGPLDGDVRAVRDDEVSKGEYEIRKLSEFVIHTVGSGEPVALVIARGVYRQRSPISFAFDWQGWK
jgi:hypothetical protein